MVFHIITLFPDSFNSYLNESILARAIKNKKIKVSFYNPRDFVKVPKSQKGKDKPYKRIDDIPYGGGPGMVMQVEPIVKAVEKALKNIRSKKPKIKIIFLSPEGKQFDTQYAKDSVKKYTDIIVICGRYEGIDERVNKIFKTEKITVGPFVLTGGELPAMIMIDCMARQIEGVLGNFFSREEERVSSNEVYTRPEIFKYKNKNYKVPEVLLSGNHKKIDEYRQMLNNCRLDTEK
jgi:tRNA (guanine37-N1)-methyltransferase